MSDYLNEAGDTASCRVWEDDDGWHWSVTTTDGRSWTGDGESRERATVEGARRFVIAVRGMVTIILPYDDALRLSYMARFPEPVKDGDSLIGDRIDYAITQAETEMAR